MTKEKITQKCADKNCSRSAIAKGLCGKHYMQWRRAGNLATTTHNRGIGNTPLERFWSKVDKTKGLGRDGDCWEWRGWIDSHGYGSFEINHQLWKIHRFSYFLATDQIPVLDVLHSCDNPSCCNPAHLREGTPLDNAADRVKRGRQASGERQGATKLLAHQVRQIRELAAQGILYQIIAVQFNISRSGVRKIVTRENWKYLE